MSLQLSVAMIRKLITLIRRAIYVLTAEGFISLCKKVAIFSFHLIHYSNHYVYEIDIQESNEIGFRPKINNFTFRIVSTNQQADELIGEGFKIPAHIIDAKYRLENGAMAYCIFVDKELAHIGWVGMTQKAKDILDPIPYHVDFTNNEVCSGDVVTIPKYRGKGLMTYGYFKRLQFLNQIGKRVLRDSVNSDNVASLRVQANFGARKYATVRCLKIFWWQFYIKKSLENAPDKKWIVMQGKDKIV